MVQRFILNETSYHGAGSISVIPEELKSRGLKKVFVCMGETKSSLFT